MRCRSDGGTEMQRMFVGLYRLIAALSLVGFGAGAGLAYLELLPAETSFLIFSSGVALGLLVVVASPFVMKAADDRAVRVPLVLALGPAAFLVYTVATTYQYPLINDISTARVYAPEFVLAKSEPANADSDLTFPAEFKAVIEEKYPDIQSLGLTEDAYTTFNRAMDLARDQEGWTITGPRTSMDGSQASYAFEGYAASKLFHFKDDFVVRVTEVDGGCVVDMRSRSRVGKGDMGANAARIRAFFSELAR